MYIYCITSPSGKKYIGQTTRGVNLRWKEHVHDAFDPNKDRCKALNNAIRKYGAEAFRVEVVARCLPWLLDEYEQFFILHFETTSPAGYNIKLGGSNGSHHTDTKAKIRASLLGRSFSHETLVRRGQARKQEKDLPMYTCGWYRQGHLQGVRVFRPGLKERRFSISKYGSLEACKAAALMYLDGKEFNGQMAVGESQRFA